MKEQDHRSPCHRLKELREHLGLSQEQLANDVGLSRFSIINYERGKTPLPGYIADAISKRYNVNREWLMDGCGEMFNYHFPEPAEGPDYKIHEMLSRVTEILESNTIYRTALASNINAFHQSIRMSQHMDRIELRVKLLEDQLVELIDKIKLLQEENASLKQCGSSGASSGAQVTDQSVRRRQISGKTEKSS
jgi:DNA-binding XRE family transcriptional regulator